MFKVGDQVVVNNKYSVFYRCRGKVVFVQDQPKWFILYLEKRGQCGFSEKELAYPDPKQWQDMTPEEKGEILLAKLEGKTIECSYDPSKYWGEIKKMQNITGIPYCHYRIKPEEPVVEKITMFCGAQAKCLDTTPNRHKGHTHCIEFNLVDGEPDTTSIVMRKL
jgi:hypothetical protein